MKRECGYPMAEHFIVHIIAKQATLSLEAWKTSTMDWICSLFDAGSICNFLFFFLSLFQIALKHEVWGLWCGRGKYYVKVLVRSSFIFSFLLVLYSHLVVILCTCHLWVLYFLPVFCWRGKLFWGQLKKAVGTTNIFSHGLENFIAQDRRVRERFSSLFVMKSTLDFFFLIWMFLFTFTRPLNSEHSKLFEGLKLCVFPLI